MTSLRLLTASALAALFLQLAPPPASTIVVIDTDSPVPAPDVAVRLRAAVLEGLDPATTRYARLTPAAAVMVPADAVRDLVETVTVVSAAPEVTFTEAVEILRGNQAVRDDLLARRCAPPAESGCGSRIAALVERVALDTERATAQKVQRLVALAAANPGARLVLVSSGWPTRDDGRAGLPPAVAALRAGGSPLVLVRTDGVVSFQGLVRDAGERLVARLGEGLVTVSSDADVTAARARLGIAEASSEVTAEVAEAVAPVAPPDAPAPPAIRGPSGAPAAQDDATLRLARAYVARFERTFAAMRWHERYEQTVRQERVYGASGGRTTTVADRRVLEAEMTLLRLPADRTWLSVRDVVSVDGRARAIADRTMPTLSAATELSIPTLRELARENGRFNIGTIVRTFSEPTLALLFLDDDHHARFRVMRRGEAREEGRRVATYAFDEQARPTVVRAGARDLPATGLVRLDADSGQVLETSLDLVDQAAGLRGRMTVAYEASARFDVLVPASMRESYASRSGETVTAEAIYSNFRRFETAGRLVPE